MNKCYLYDINNKKIIDFDMDLHEDFNNYIGIKLHPRYEIGVYVNLIIKHYNPKVRRPDSPLCYEIAYPQKTINDLIEAIYPYLQPYKDDIVSNYKTTFPPILKNYKSNYKHTSTRSPFIRYYEYNIENLSSILDEEYIKFRNVIYRFPIRMSDKTNKDMELIYHDYTF
jgi:hypothetical protein